MHYLELPDSAFKIYARTPHFIIKILKQFSDTSSMKLKNNISLIIIIFVNLINLYFIIELSNYDEMLSYVENEGEKITSLEKTVIVFMFTSTINLLFVCIVFMKNAILPVNIKQY